MAEQQKTSLVVKTKAFCGEVVTELKKSTWPNRKDLINSTILVIVTMVVLGGFVAVADFVFIKFVGMLTKSA